MTSLQVVPLMPPYTVWGPGYLSDAATIGSGAVIGAMHHIDKSVVIGQNSRIQGHVYICPGTIIGNDVFIGPGVTFTNDKYPPSKRLKGSVIGNNVVICAGAIIGPGLEVGEGAIVCMGSLVTRSIPPGEVWRGNPARYVMTTAEYEHKRDLWEATE